MKKFGLVVLVALLALLSAVSLAPAAEAPSNGTITIPISEYEKLMKSEEAKKKDQYWNMSFEQILDKESNNYSQAWEKYDFWVLRTIYLDTGVNDSSAGALIRKIETLNRINSLPITMVINSPGGSVFAGFNILNAMNNSVAQINTECDGWAMSMAAVILSNGSLRSMNQGCIFMIHEVGTGAPSGQTTTHIKFAETIVNVENVLAEILSENSGLSVKDVRAAWEYETFYSAEETVTLGFADRVTGKTKRTAPARTIPEDLLPLNKMRRTLNERLTR